MRTFNYKPNQANESHLAKVIEPLASYICATERPKSALLSALAVLVREVEATNRAAIGHFHNRSEIH